MLWLLKITNCHEFQGTHFLFLDAAKEMFTYLPKGSKFTFYKFHYRKRKISQFVNVRVNITVRK